MNKASLTIINHIGPFLDYCEIEKGLSNNTQKNYKQYLQLFVDWIKKDRKEGMMPEDLTAEDIWDYRLYLARTYKTPSGTYLGKKSQNYYLIAIRAFLNYLADREVQSLPSSKVKLAKQKSEENISFLETFDMERILKVPDTTTPNGLRDRTMMELLFSSGMRISELLSLNTDQLSFINKKMDPNATFELSIVGKGKYVRTIFISPRSAEWLKKYLDSRKDVFRPLFINFRSTDGDNTRLSPRYVQLMISKSARIAGLSKKVTPHTLRHTYATDLLSHGADLRSVQELLGHKNVSTTQVYTHVTNKRLRDIHEKFHGGDQK